MKRNVVVMMMPTGRRVSSFVNDHLQSRLNPSEEIPHPREMATEAIDKSIFRASRLRRDIKKNLLHLILTPHLLRCSSFHSLSLKLSSGSQLFPAILIKRILFKLKILEIPSAIDSLSTHSVFLSELNPVGGNVGKNILVKYFLSFGMLWKMKHVGFVIKIGEILLENN